MERELSQGNAAGLTSRAGSHQVEAYMGKLQRFREKGAAARLPWWES